ncbi:YfiR family protein [Achromobacter aloeverae]|uniref:YfiR family protein n=1 Tax=Achromobacter aloeverae TaxID=1750518 RepID=UPI001864CB80|nr:YfiR family protein [Achromobacter aloeverae]
MSRVASRGLSPAPSCASLRALSCALLCALSCACVPARAADAPAHDAPAPATSAARAVAQVVTGIIGYARWPTPPHPEPPLLCVTGTSPYSAALLSGDDSMASVRAHRVAPGDDRVPQMCEALYIGDLPQTALTRLLQGVIGKPVVTILENDPDCSAGGMFCLNVQGTQVGFQINLDIIARSGVRIHPSVLQLARRKPHS